MVEHNGPWCPINGRRWCDGSGKTYDEAKQLAIAEVKKGIAEYRAKKKVAAD